VRQIEWAGERLELSKDRAIHWPRRRTLIIADPHFGKAAAFRHRGVPVPAGTTQTDVDRLTKLLRLFSAERLVVLGDFLHARAGRAESTMATLARWRQEHRSLEVLLVRGNHDLKAGDPPAEWNFTCADEPLMEDPFAWCHEPRAAKGSFVVAGHIHPCAVLHDVDGSTARVACFHFARRVAILPAFGTFTGTHPVRPRSGDRVFAVGPEVIELRTNAARS
jgi:uncharacterized protein